MTIQGEISEVINMIGCMDAKVDKCFLSHVYNRSYDLCLGWKRQVLSGSGFDSGVCNAILEHGGPLLLSVIYGVFCVGI